MIEIDTFLKFLKVCLQEIDAWASFLVLQYDKLRQFGESVIALSNPYYLISAFFLLLGILLYIYLYKTFYVRKWLEYTPGLVLKKELDDYIVIKSSSCFSATFSGKMLSQIFLGITGDEIESGSFENHFVTCIPCEGQKIIAGYLTVRRIIFFGRRYFVSFSSLTIEDLKQIFGYNGHCSYLLVQTQGFVLSGSNDLVNLYQDKPEMVQALLHRTDDQCISNEKESENCGYDRENGWIWLSPIKFEIGVVQLFFLQAVKSGDLQRSIDSIPFPLEIPVSQGLFVNKFHKKIVTDLKLEGMSDYRPLAIDWYDLELSVKCRIGKLICENQLAVQARLLKVFLEKMLLGLNTYRNVEPGVFVRFFMGEMKVLNPVSLSLEIDGEVVGSFGELISDSQSMQNCFDYQFTSGDSGVEIFLRLDYELTEMFKLFIEFVIKLICRPVVVSEKTGKNKPELYPIVENRDIEIENKIYREILSRLTDTLQNVCSRVAVSNYSRETEGVPMVTLKESLLLNRLSSYWSCLSDIDGADYDKSELNFLELLCEKISEELFSPIGERKRLTLAPLPDNYPDKFLMLSSQLILDVVMTILVSQIISSAKPRSEISVIYSETAKLIYVKAGMSVNNIGDLIKDKLEILMLNKIKKMLTLDIRASDDTVSISINN